MSEQKPHKTSEKIQSTRLTKATSNEIYLLLIVVNTVIGWAPVNLVPAYLRAVLARLQSDVV
jgi:hypothetical protein